MPKDEFSLLTHHHRHFIIAKRMQNSKNVDEQESHANAKSRHRLTDQQEKVDGKSGGLRVGQRIERGVGGFEAAR